MLNACLRRYPWGRSFPAAITSPGAAPPHDAEPWEAARGSRWRPHSCGRGLGSTAVRSQHVERPRRLICSRGYECRSRAAEWATPVTFKRGNRRRYQDI
ncbi:hypothetical protein NDU88_003370 [Pleurodeles waltl]|uniref:Uncharacterized protein n=1 Tax=Pleurodeles waltl TaxID=8319 RepID=A0AAV7VF70_PLEWA|nr:hypothetical protein NDU88_003370 [Pleurodeles waltl]